MEQFLDNLDKVGWLGEAPYVISRRKTIPVDGLNSASFLRRILISWLIGRPVTQIARRVRCSPRLVYRAITEAIYQDQDGDQLMYWAELGLIGLPALPPFESMDAIVS